MTTPSAPPAASLDDRALTLGSVVESLQRLDGSAGIIDKWEAYRRAEHLAIQDIGRVLARVYDVTGLPVVLAPETSEPATAPSRAAAKGAPGGMLGRLLRYVREESPAMPQALEAPAPAPLRPRAGLRLLGAWSFEAYTPGGLRGLALGGDGVLWLVRAYARPNGGAPGQWTQGFRHGRERVYERFVSYDNPWVEGAWTPGQDFPVDSTLVLRGLATVLSQVERDLVQATAARAELGLRPLSAEATVGERERNLRAAVAELDASVPQVAGVPCPVPALGAGEDDPPRPSATLATAVEVPALTFRPHGAAERGGLDAAVPALTVPPKSPQRRARGA